jgi:hypothetical protein
MFVHNVGSLHIDLLNAMDNARHLAAVETPERYGYSPGSRVKITRRVKSYRK